MNLKAKVAIVSGGAKGIGESIVRTFVQHGGKVLFIDKDKKAGLELESYLSNTGADVRFFEGDLTEDGICKQAVEQAVQEFGGIDILVNNAGINDHVGLDADPSEFINSIRLNLMHCFELVKYSAPYIRKNKGRIINIASKVAQTGQGGTSGYAASKGALLALTREWAVDFAEFGATVNAVVPAEVYTPMYEQELAKALDPNLAREKVNYSVPLEHRLTNPDEIAHMVLFLASPLAAHITGQHMNVDGGYVHLDRMYTQR